MEMLLNALSKHSFLWNLSQATITDTKRHVEQMLYVLVRYRIQVFCTNQTPINLAFYKEFTTIYKNSFNEIIMELKNIRQISKDRTHRTLIVGLIFGIEEHWNTGSKAYIVSLIELLFCSMISKYFSQMPLYS